MVFFLAVSFSHYLAFKGDAVPLILFYRSILYTVQCYSCCNGWYLSILYQPCCANTIVNAQDYVKIYLWRIQDKRITAAGILQSDGSGPLIANIFKLQWPDSYIVGLRDVVLTCESNL